MPKVNTDAGTVSVHPVPWQHNTVLQERRREPFLPLTPVLSSQHTGWKTLQLEQYHLPAPGESSTTLQGYHLCFFLTGPVTIARRTSVSSQEYVIGQHEICIGVHGEPCNISWRQPFDVALFFLSPKIMLELGAEYASGHATELQSVVALHDEHLQALCKLLLQDVALGSPAGPLYGDQLGTALAVYLHARFSQRPRRLEPRPSQLPGHTLQRICNLIEARLSTPTGLDDLAEEAGLSRFHFAKLFRNTTGKTPYQYVIERRLHRAHQLLADKNSSVHQIALATGFSSHSHLASMLRRRTGLTPGQLRLLEKL